MGILDFIKGELIDVIGGFTISIRSAGRDVSIGL